MVVYYPESKVEINGFMAKHYDILIDIATFGKYRYFIKQVVDLMKIQSEDRIVDFGAGTGRNACLMRKHLSARGEIIGFDISPDMIEQFRRECARFSNVGIVHQRIDKSIPYKEKFDKAFISFVLHGFPHNVRKQIIKNVFRVLKAGGVFFILDYNEFFLDDAPLYFKVLFRAIECPYAFDFIEKDWRNILRDEGFEDFEEYLFFGKYVRLIKVKKIKQ